MFHRINKSDVVDLRAMLVDAGYDTETLTTLLGSARPPGPGEAPRMLSRTRAPTAINALVRLFLLGTSLPEEDVRGLLPQPVVDMALQTGLLVQGEDRVHAQIVIVPVRDLLFASDAFRKLGTADAGEFVLPAYTGSARFLRRLTLRSKVGTTLDLGCGCGIHALFAARHSDRVVASDISPAAVQYTRFNAQLNGIDNVECVEGNLFEPLAGQRFDLIISNPPFILGPSSKFTYRDNKLELDEFCRALVREAPAFLNDGAYLQLLCEWAEIEGESWRDRLSKWVNGTSCDAWVLHTPARDPASYVVQRMSDIEGREFEPGAGYEEWLRYFDERKVSAVHPGLIVLRRGNDPGWFQVRSLAREPDSDAGEAIGRNIAACDFLAVCDDDASLLDAVLAVAPELELAQKFRREDGAWDSGTARLRMQNGLPMDTDIDLPILASLNQVDGKRTVAESIDAFCRLSGADSAVLTPQLLPVVRLFVRNGFLEPAGFDG